eukprot:4636929-Lingulodinium_polyedra.AAC.1
MPSRRTLTRGRLVWPGRAECQAIGTICRGRGVGRLRILVPSLRSCVAHRGGVVGALCACAR